MTLTRKRYKKMLKKCMYSKKPHKLTHAAQVIVQETKPHRPCSSGIGHITPTPPPRPLMGRLQRLHTW